MNRLYRGLFTLTLLLGLLIGLVGPSLIPVKAAPQRQAVSPGDVVISEFRFLGPTGGSDEFIELFNPKNTTVDISDFKIMGSNNVGGETSTPRATLGSVFLQAGQHYLLVNDSASAGLLALQDATYPKDISDDGGIALTLADGTTIIDAVGLSSGSAYKEGTPLPPLISGTANQSYERKDNGCTDTNNNSIDFLWNQTSSNPQNLSSVPVISCLRVTDVTSTALNNTYQAGAAIPILITFSTNVNVTGFPQLLLETGTTDEPAIYSSGSGSNVLTFNYIVKAGDVSADLDYVATNSLSLNGGTITGAVGNVNLTLPNPGTPGSLGANKHIVIDNGVAPSIVSFKRQTPITTPTDSDTLIFRATFSEPVTGVDINAFAVNGVTGTTIGVIPVNNSVYDVTVSGGVLALSTFNGIVGLDLGNISLIKDTVGMALLPGEPTVQNDETYTVDNIAPTVTVNQAAGQADPTGGTPINFTVVFSEPINTNLFTANSITQAGGIAASLITWRIIDSGDHITFTLSAIAVATAATGTIQPTIAAGQVTDLAGNGNTPSTGADNTVTFNGADAPSVTINQAVGQADPTNVLPIKFTVVFSEAIIVSTFTPSDITQNGTATGVTWAITDSGDHTNFSLSATVVTGAGSLKPFIDINRVLDLVSINNTASTSTDNTVLYDLTGPTVTINQAVGQLDPTTNLPINFTVVFSDPINVSTFTPADITQSGTSLVNTWIITDLGDHKTFTLAATSLSRNGTVIPSIAANKVTDMVGNNNKASTSTDNSVTSNARLTTPTPTASPTPSATPTLGLLINEVAWMGTQASASDEWIELYNPSTVDISLTGWKLVSTNGVISILLEANDSNNTIHSGEYYVLAPVSAFTDVVIRQNITVSLNDNGMSLQLISPAGILVDTANANGGTWPAGVASTRATMERHATTLDHDTSWFTFAGTALKHDRNNNLVKGTPGYANWATTVTATPTKVPTATLRPPTARPVGLPPIVATLVINEFLPRAGFDWNKDGKVDVFDEYIEIANLGPIDANLANWKLDDLPNGGSSPFTLPSRTLKPGERAVFYASQTNVLLGDGGDTVRLLNPNNVIKDAHTYSLVKVADQSICRLPDINGSWYTDCVPTPNARNSRTGTVPSAPPGTGLEESLCQLPDTLPADFQLAECYGFGSNMWNPAYWDGIWQGDRSVPQNGSKWDTFIE